MAHPVSLEDFRRPDKPVHESEPPTPEIDIEAERCAAYQEGLRDGRAAAEEESRADQSRLVEEAVQALRDLEFGYTEARAHVLAGATRLLSDIISHILPRSVRATLGARIIEELSPLLEDAAGQQVQIAAPAGSTTWLAPLLAQTNLPLDLREDAALEDGQLLLQLGAEARMIDWQDALSPIADAVEAFTSLNEEALDHG